jgi:hypothetical protein
MIIAMLLDLLGGKKIMWLRPRGRVLKTSNCEWPVVRVKIDDWKKLPFFFLFFFLKWT